MDAQTRLPDTLTDRRCRLLAVALIVGSALLRLLYLACNCPLDLSPDEAHYWDWSRHLDWSYYSKGPGVAWLIRLSCEKAPARVSKSIVTVAQNWADIAASSGDMSIVAL